MVLDTKLAAIIVAAVVSFTVLAWRGVVDQETIKMVAMSIVSLIGGIFIERKKPIDTKPPSAPTLPVLALAGLLAVGAIGCALFKSSVVPSDLEKDYECVAAQIEQGVTSIDQIERVCLPGQGQTIVDIVELFLESQEFAAKHPAQVPALHRELAHAKAAAARKADDAR